MSNFSQNNHEEFKNVSLESSDFFLLPDAILNSENASIIKFRHPRSQIGAVFLLEREKKVLYEIISFDEIHRSWIVGNFVHSNGRILMAVEFNPVYLILPYLRKATRKVPLVQVLEDEEFKSMVELSNMDVDLSCIADRKGDPDLNVWCYNEESTLSFLKERVFALALKLQKNKEHTPQGFSALMKSLDDDTPHESYLLLAFGMLSELLEEPIEKKLMSHLNLPDISKKNENKVTPQAKKLKPCDPNEIHQNIVSNNKPRTSESAKTKALAKSAAGTKSITSFFQKK